MMSSYLIKRFVSLFAVLLAMSLIVFCLQSLIPADPARAIAGPSAPVETVEAVRKELGLNDPLVVQYGRFLGQLLHGDLGTSVRTRQPVASDIAKYLPASLELACMAMIMGTAMALLLALLQNTTRGAGVLRMIMLAAGSTPIFLSALLLVYFVWFKLDLLPGSGRLSLRRFSGPTGFNVLDGLLVGKPEVSLDALQHLILPALALALPVAVAVGRSLNSSLHDVLKQTYIRTVRGKGLGEADIVVRHGLRNAASAPLAMIGLQIGLLFGNLLIVERVFSWPGLGLYVVQAFAVSDLPAVLGVSMVFGTFYILINMVIEILQSVADPRIRL
ncbi:MAG TPA: ABC transporter permease [Ensifer sp.]|nr:ABC transporter permease [Ensifer sp.]